MEEQKEEMMVEEQTFDRAGLGSRFQELLEPSEESLVEDPPLPAPNIVPPEPPDLIIDRTFETSIILVHDLAASMALQEYKKLNAAIGIFVQRFTHRVVELYNSGEWSVLKTMEEISGQPQCRCSGVIVLERPQRFGIMGDGQYAWPQIAKVVAGAQTFLMQAVPDNFQEFIYNTREVLAVRGFPDDKAGMAIQAITALYMEYINHTTMVNTLTIFRPSYFVPQGKDKKNYGQG